MAQMADIVMAFSQDIMQLVKMVMDSNVGLNRKIGFNTLRGSDIYKTLAVKATNDGDLIFDIILNDYIVYIESGRRAGAKFPPVEPIVKWCRKHGIPTDNSTVYLIRRAISRGGIKPRPVMQYVFEEVTDYWENGWADKVFDKIITEIDNFFNT